MYTVLLIDDEPRILRGLHKTFKWGEMGFEVIAETTDSVKALELIFSLNPDVVFTDIRMPEIDGIELMKKVRAKGLDTEFVVISGFAEFEFAREALKVGALDYIMKPLDRELAGSITFQACPAT